MSIGNHRDRFEKEWDKANKDIDRGFNLIFVLAILFSLVILSAIIVGIILAWKNWG